MLEWELFKINQYVDMVLQYQRLSSMKNDLLPESFAVPALVKRAAKNCAPLFIHKGLSLDAEDIHGSIITDGKWFCFVLEQLLTNAVKYTANGTVRVYSRDADGGSILIIEDNGVGIPSGDLPRVFERGFTGEAGRTERSSTGIGLYLCKQILTRLGFGISIESEAGKGTRVILRLAQDKLEMD